MVDIYLLRRNWSFVMRRPFIKRQRILSRQLSVSLIDARHQPTSLDLFSGPHGKCFLEAQPLLWFDQTTHRSSRDNAWDIFEDELSGELKKKYGVLNVSPLVDQLGRECIGVLAIHVGPERNAALKALGALNSQKGRLRVSNACIDLHGFLVR